MHFFDNQVNLSHLSKSEKLFEFKVYLHVLSYLRELFLVVQRRMKKKLIIDVDTGVDDAQAIMVALTAPDVEVLGITCCHGNTDLENVLKNTLRVLRVCNRLDVSLRLTVTTEIGARKLSFFFLAFLTYTLQIPVYAGCSEPMIAQKRHAGHYHGKDGLGDVPDPDAPDLELLQKEEAAHAIINTVNQNPGEVGKALNKYIS